MFVAIFNKHLKIARCDGSATSVGKADLGLKGPGFNPPPRQDNFSYFKWLALEPMTSTCNCHIAVNTCNNK